MAWVHGGIGSTGLGAGNGYERDPHRSYVCRMDRRGNSSDASKLGFSRSFYLLPVFDSKPDWAAKEPLFYFHGFVFSAWFALLALQTCLIRIKEIRLHRTLGIAGACLGAVVVLLGSCSAIFAANRPTGFMDVPFPPDQFLIIPLSGVLLFAVFLSLAIVWRKQPPRHKRLMLLASIRSWMRRSRGCRSGRMARSGAACYLRRPFLRRSFKPP